MTRAPSSPANARWYLVNTQTGRERLAMDHLERQNYLVFTPWLRKTVRHARKTNTVRATLFPGYIFVALDITSQRWRPIDGTVGVLRLVRTGETPTVAPAGLVEAMIDAQDEEGCVSFQARLTPGETVRVNAGPFTDQLAVVENLNGPDRVRVLLSFVHQAVRIDLPARDVVPMTKAARAS